MSLPGPNGVRSPVPCSQKKRLAGEISSMDTSSRAGKTTTAITMGNTHKQTRQKQTPRYREQTDGCQMGEGSEAG